MSSQMPMPRDEFRSMLGEGFHTAFRKATDCDQAHPIWTLINQMPSGDWGAVLEFVTYGFEVSYGLAWADAEP